MFNNGLLDVFRQPGITAPRGVFRGVRLGDVHPERIVPSIRQARVVGPNLSDLRSVLSPPVSNVSSPVSSIGSFKTVPLNSPASSVVSRGSVYEGVASRLAQGGRNLVPRLARGAAVIGRGLMALGPIGVAIGVALAAAAAIGGLAYLIYKHQRGNSAEKIDKNINDALDEDIVIDEPRVPVAPPKKKPIEEPTGLADWSGNVPWVRRPGKDLDLDAIFRKIPLLRAFSLQ
jgi:hypothetical protein